MNSHVQWKTSFPEAGLPQISQSVDPRTDPAVNWCPLTCLSLVSLSFPFPLKNQEKDIRSLTVHITICHDCILNPSLHVFCLWSQFKCDMLVWPKKRPWESLLLVKQLQPKESLMIKRDSSGCFWA